MKRVATALLLLAVMFIVGCGGSTNNPNKLESQAQRNDSLNYQRNQPVPGFNFSQKRQNLIEIETAEAKGVQTTSFFFNFANKDPQQVCPSVGAPIPTTTQLSNPVQIGSSKGTGGSGNVPIGQMDPTGVYTGDSTGTYVLCVGADGTPYANYWEGYVQTIFGPAKWDYNQHEAVLVGPPSFKFSK